MLELIVGLFLGVATFFLIKKGIESSAKEELALEQAQAAAKEEIKAVPVLTIENTESFRGPRGFVKSFGIQPSYVADLKFFKGENQLLEQLPAKVRRCLEISYKEGSCRGPEVPGILCRNEPLEAGKALYFALMDYGKNNIEVVCFVDKVR